MRLIRKQKSRSSSQPDWRKYQDTLKSPRRATKRIRFIPVPWQWITLFFVAIVAILILFFVGSDEAGYESVGNTASSKTVRQDRLIEKTDFPIFLGNTQMINLTKDPIRVDFDGQVYLTYPSIDTGLQQYMLKRMDRVNSRYIGIVVMEPETGRLSVLAGFNKNEPNEDPCLAADYPAASLFKIVTAAAAIEEKGYTARTRLSFNGYKHTLYKRQLTDKKNRYTNSISLKNSFAQSVNPVFGKIGALYLGKEALEVYGNAFAFNRKIAFELPLSMSKLKVNDDSYHRAEIASGFNRQTTISPIHGAVIVSAVINEGVPVEPTVIDRVENKQGSPIYLSEPRFLSPAVSKETADVLKQLMIATVTSGTAKKIFRGHHRNKVLSRLHLGGKTGSIYNRSHDARFDWFVGFATEKNGTEKLVVSVMVAHEEYIGTRAAQYARMVIERHFKNYFSKKKKTAGKNPSE